MYITPHVLFGASVSLAIGDPVIGFLGGVASHYLLDAIPHADSGTIHYGELTGKNLDKRDYIASFVDVTLAIVVITWLAGNIHPLVSSLIIWGALGGAAPDVLVLLKLFFPKAASNSVLKAYYYYTDKIEYTVKPKYWFWGVVTQVLTIGGSLWYLLAL